MNTIHEIGIHNQQDFWAMLYMYVGRSILDVCGRRGEKAVRLAVREMAREKGKKLASSYREQGVKTNLETLFAGGNHCSDDPRVRMEVLRQDEDIRIWEIYTCPMASLWLDAGQAGLGNMYCEENQHGLVEGFTGGVGQLNLTKKLTCHRTNGCRADNYCRFSSYYRAANCGGEQCKASFTAPDEEYQPYVPEEPANGRETIREKCVQTVYYMTKAARDLFGEEGLCAVALGLKALASSAAELVLHNEDATLSADRPAFLAANIPVSLDPAADPLWEDYGGYGARELFEINFLEPFKRALDLQ